jgi:DNA excision repair protein ERCC-3
MRSQEMTEALRDHSKYPISATVVQDIEDLAGRYGRVVIECSIEALRGSDGHLILSVDSESLAEFLAREDSIGPLVSERIRPTRFRFEVRHRGVLKQALISLGLSCTGSSGVFIG